MWSPYRFQGVLVASMILLAASPARAQHRGPGEPARGGNAHAAPRGNPAAIPQISPQFQKQMEQQYRQAMQQEQAQMAAMAKQAQQAHQNRLQGFQQWAKNNSASPGQSQASGLSHLPQSPYAFAAWYRTQKRHKAMNRSYDPAFDQYRAYEKTQQASRHHHSHLNPTATAHTTPQPSSSTLASTHPGRVVPSVQARSSAARSNPKNAPQQTTTQVQTPLQTQAPASPSQPTTLSSNLPNSTGPMQESVVPVTSAPSSNLQQMPLSQMTFAPLAKPQQMPITPMNSAPLGNLQQMPLSQMTFAPLAKPQQMPITPMNSALFPNQQMPLSQMTFAPFAKPQQMPLTQIKSAPLPKPQQLPIGQMTSTPLPNPQQSPTPPGQTQAP